MILEAQSLQGELLQTQSLEGELNVGINHVYPTLENLEVTPSVEEQVFNHENSYGYDEVKVKAIDINLQQKTITPTKAMQEVTFDENYDGLSKVSVYSIPDTFIEPSGTLEITTNDTFDVSGFESVTTNVHEPSPYAPQFISFYSTPNGVDISEDLVVLDTSNITNFNYMFCMCSYLTSLDINHFNTSNVTNMSNMFASSNKITTLDLSDWDTSNVTNLTSAFMSASGLTSLNIKNWNVTKVTTFYRMFMSCYGLTELDLSNWVTTSATNMREMFSGCNKLTRLDIRNFDFTKVTTYTNMFNSVPSGCLIIVKDTTTKSWITSKFSNLTNVKTIDEL